MDMVLCINCLAMPLDLHSGLGRGAVVAEKEAEAAVAAAKAAARQQQEHALQRCNAEWTDRLGEATCTHATPPLISYALQCT